MALLARHHPPPGMPDYDDICETDYPDYNTYDEMTDDMSICSGSVNDLLDQLEAKGVRNPDYTRALIKEKLNDQDSEIATTSCKVSLACPLGKNRMRIPARASTCDHLQCFDAQTYLMMNERKPKWNCPVCNKTAEPVSLQIDGFFQDLVK